MTGVTHLIRHHIRHQGIGPIFFGAAAFIFAPQASAQSVGVGVEATTDEVRRGLSWSDGEISGSADARAGFGGFDASVRMAMLRKSDRHANADVVADLALGRDWNAGAFTLRTEAIGHVFGNADSAMNYAELGVGARYSIGPLQVGTMAWYAPGQDSIGGDNLHLRATADAGLPGFPVSVSVQLGTPQGIPAMPGRRVCVRPRTMPIGRSVRNTPCFRLPLASITLGPISIPPMRFRYRPLPICNMQATGCWRVCAFRFDDECKKAPASAGALSAF